jgi:uracil-DNA glycosylase
VEGEAVEGSVVKKVEAVVKASVLGGNAGGKEKETVVEKKGVVGKAEGDENAAPEVDA